MSSRQDRKRQARERREAAERRANHTAARRRRGRLAGAVATVLLAAALLVALVTSSDDQRPRGAAITAAPIPPQRITDLDQAVRRAGAQRVSYRYEFGINEHTSERVDYPTNPPTNGPHAFSWAADGNYAGQPAPPTTEVVHAQEHGRIVVQYRAGLPRRTIQQLVALFEESPEHMLLVENATDMPCDVAATAWGQALLCRTVDERTFDALRAFRDRCRDRGPEVAQ